MSLIVSPPLPWSACRSARTPSTRRPPSTSATGFRRRGQPDCHRLWATKGAKILINIKFSTIKMYNTPTLLIWQYSIRAHVFPVPRMLKLFEGFSASNMSSLKSRIYCSVSINVKNLVGCVDFLIQWWAQVN